MRTKAPVLLPIFRSRLQGELLASVLLDPDHSSSVTDLARRIGRDVASVQREVDRLEKAGITKSDRVGRSRMVSADVDSPLFEPLAQLVTISFGPRWVLADELGAIEGIDQAYLFGSWARSYQDKQGPAPRDIDVLVIGSPNRDELYEATLKAEKRLRQPIDVTVRSKRTWLDAGDGFIRELRTGPLVPILETDEAFDALG